MKDIVNEGNVNFRVGVLSTIDSPLLPFFLESILGQKMKNIVVICDSNKFQAKTKKSFLNGLVESLKDLMIEIQIFIR